MAAIELQAEALAVAQLEVQGFGPLWLPASMTHAVAQGVAQALAALHEQGVGGRLPQFEGWRGINEAMLPVEVTGLVVGYII